MDKSKQRSRFLLIMGIVVVVVIIGRMSYKAKYPYGSSHCCIIQMQGALDQYAAENNGRYPAGGATPEADLSVLWRSNYVNAYLLRGMTVPESAVRAVLERGGLLGPDTCGWQYVQGLTSADNPRLALLYCKEPLGHNGNKTKDGGRQVVFVGGGIDWISGATWSSFLNEQKDLLSKRTERERSGAPLVDAVIELPDGSRIEKIETSYSIESQQIGTDKNSSHGTTMGGSLVRQALVWLNAPTGHDFSGSITRTLSFSNLVSTPVTVQFINGMPDKTNVIFKMLPRS